MKTIHKYPLICGNKPQVIFMKQDAKILCVHNHHDMPCFWAEVNDQKPDVQRTFVVYTTGEPIDQSLHLQYLGSAIGYGEVWHIYEVL